MPMGVIGKVEQDKLMHLETILRTRVIGQDDAVASIADAIRRARSGINDPKRPIGTFLFMGPTGVGKTETAKALAESYFGNAENMLRFDMSEYQEEDGFDKLVGSFEKNEPGLLTSHLRASPYALVLLDEFEKSNPKIRNLFLQILDEGFFTDYLGHKVNMRNTIIIATSNAGANLIWDAVNKGIDPVSLKKEIFTSIQTAGLYSPELLNRFDEVVIFHPLGPDVLSKIARIRLQDLAARLAASKNITLAISDPLVEAVAKAGYDAAFGARPMNRVIQDKVEKLIANKIIQGEATSGGTVTFSPADIASIG
jgi:ATP-dependent Clp protease ATP-binding subunit ClpC